MARRVPSQNIGIRRRGSEVGDFQDDDSGRVRRGIVSVTSGRNIGVRDIRDLRGTVEREKAERGVFITTSRFTPDARKYVDQIEKKVVLIDGAMLADLMIEHSVGVAVVQTYAVKKIDVDYFEDAPFGAAVPTG